MRRRDPSWFEQHPILTTLLGTWVVGAVASGVATVIAAARVPLPPPEPLAPPPPPAPPEPSPDAAPVRRGPAIRRPT